MEATPIVGCEIWLMSPLRPELTLKPPCEREMVNEPRIDTWHEQTVHSIDSISSEKHRTRNTGVQFFFSLIYGIAQNDPEITVAEPTMQSGAPQLVGEGAMEYSTKRSRSSSSSHGHDFSAKEREVANILVHFDHCRKNGIGWNSIIPEWGIRRKRSSGISNYNNANDFPATKCRSSPTTPLSLSLSATDSDDAADPPRPPARPLPSASKNERVKARKAPSKRGPKKKTHKELKDMVCALSLERDRLEQEKEKLLKTYRDLEERNGHLKSQLALQLDIRREAKMSSTPQPTSSDPDSAQETSVWFDLSPFHNGDQGSENFGAMLPSSSACDELRNIRRSSDPCSPVSPSGSEKGDSFRRGENSFYCSGVPDLNAPGGALADAVPNDFDDQLLPSMNKAAVAAKARRRRLELTRVKYPQFHKPRLR